MKAREIKKPKPSLSIDEPPFDLPSNWCWALLGEFSAYIQRGKSPKYTAAEGSPVVSQKCVQWDGLDLTVAKLVTLESLEKYDQIRVLRDGDLLWNSTGTGTIGRVIRLLRPPPKLVCDSHVTVVRCLLADPEYVRTWLRTDYVYGVIEERAAGSTNQVELTAQMANGQPVPLPPHAEQHRIVAKVDELMELCDGLEAARVDREATRDRLAAASLARLDEPDPDPAIFRVHAAFALDTLAPLTTRPDQIKVLRQTILNLAVRGKLVAQNPNDEPASELLRRIAAEKTERKKTQQTSDPTTSIPGRDVTPGWVITTLQSVCASITDGDHLPPPKTESGIPFLVIGNIRSQTIKFAGSRFVAPEYYEGLDPIRRPRSGDLLYTLVGSYGIPVLVRDDQPFCVQRHIGILRPSKLIDVKFLARAMESRLIFEQTMACATGIAQKTVPLSGLRKLLIPLPPLAEQHRIVAKVDVLIALCDRLEESLTTGNDACHRLFDALLAEALDPHKPER